MKSSNRVMAGILAMAAFVLLQNPSFAQEKAKESKAGHSHEKSEIHGGEVLMSKQHHFEVVWMADHVMVYLYDHHEKALSAKGVTGEVTFKFKDGKTEKAELMLMEVAKMKGMEMEEMHKKMADQDHLMAKVNLEGVKEGEVKATFTLKGLTEKGENEATFAAKYKKMKVEHQHDSKSEHNH